MVSLTPWTCFFLFLHPHLPSAVTGAKWTSFEIVWNTNSAPCKANYNVSIPVESYGISANKNQTFYGDKIVLFYEKKLGYYPYVDKKGKAHNGGIPQKADLVAHLKRVVEDIRIAIPNSGFTGNAVIDWEGWWPVWKVNWGHRRIYKKLSYQLAKKYLPHSTKRQRRKLARQQFETSAKRFMLATLALCIQLRPYAKWGFYGYPLCLHKEDNYCTTRKANDKWKWLLKASTGLYPTIYLRTPDLKKTQVVRQKIIQAHILEAQRFVTKWKSIPIYPFTRILYDPYHRKTDEFYSKPDLCSSLKQSADLGVSGVIVWGSWFSVSTKANCQLMSDYVQDLFGPYSMLVKDQAASCSKKNCNNKGIFHKLRCRAPYQGSRCQKSVYWNYYKWRT